MRSYHQSRFVELFHDLSEEEMRAVRSQIEEEDREYEETWRYNATKSRPANAGMILDKPNPAPNPFSLGNKIAEVVHAWHAVCSEYTRRVEIEKRLSEHSHFLEEYGQTCRILKGN